MDELIGRLSQEFHVRPEHAQAVVELLDEGNTVPFIARYRKERHGAMDDQTIRELADRLAYLRGLEARKKEIRRPDHPAPGVLRAYRAGVGGAQDGALWLFGGKD